MANNLTMANRYDIDLVRSRADIFTLISRYVNLNKRSGRFIGLCPFHNEKTPSFSVDVDKGFWHCFGCGKGGDSITFAMEINRFDFLEAVEFLAEMYHIAPFEDGQKQRQKVEVKRAEKDLIHAANAKAINLYQKALNGKSGAHAFRYLKERGITEEDILRFSLGYAPNMWDALSNKLLGEFTQEILIKAGLVTKRQNSDGVYDRFRNRLIIPIFNRDGLAIAFGGRALLKEDNPKYLNTAETAVFHKGNTLYAFNLAVNAIKDKKRAIVTEGYFDVIACHKAGFIEAVATLGTSLTEEHVKLLKRFADVIYLIYDGDSAGINAALRAQSIFRENDVIVKIVILPKDEDPDTFIRTNGAEDMENLLKNALSPIEFELNILINTIPHTDADGFIRLQREAAKVLVSLPLIERATYAHIFAEKIAYKSTDVTRVEQNIFAEIGTLGRNKNYYSSADLQTDTASFLLSQIEKKDVALEREALACALRDEKLAEKLVVGISEGAITSYDYNKLFFKLLFLYNENRPLTVDEILKDSPEMSKIISIILLRTPEAKEGQFDKVILRLLEKYNILQVDKEKVLNLDSDELKKFIKIQKKRSEDKKKDILGE